MRMTYEGQNGKDYDGVNLEELVLYYISESLCMENLDIT